MHEVEAKGILSANNNMNIYRGCSHGCIYCDARSKCYEFNHEFEDIEVKTNVVSLLEKKLISKRKKCMIMTGAMSDPYIHLEEKLGNTRACLELIEKYGFGVSILTKSNRILRDMDILKKINEKSKCVIQMTLTTYDDNLCRIIEPNVSSTKERFEVLMCAYENNIPTVVWLTPILPFINDSEKNLRGILNYCIEAKVKGIVVFDMGVTLREGNREYYYGQLDKYFPKLRSVYEKKYTNRYIVSSPNAKYLMNIFVSECRKHNIECDVNKVFAYLSEFPEEKGEEQLMLF